MSKEDKIQRSVLPMPEVQHVGGRRALSTLTPNNHNVRPVAAPPAAKLPARAARRWPQAALMGLGWDASMGCSVMRRQATSSSCASGRGPPVSESSQTIGQFEIGQHVYIQNTVGHVRLKCITTADRASIVTKITGDRSKATRVWVTTYNGHSTWRHPSNLRHLLPSERTRIEKLQTTRK